MSRSKDLFTIKNLSNKIKSDPYKPDLKIIRGFIYLKKKNYKKAIDDFNIVIRQHKQVNISGTTPKRFLYIRKDKLRKIYLLRSFAYAISGDMAKSRKDFNDMCDIDCPMKYVSFIIFSWHVLHNEIEKAISKYSRLRSYSSEILDFEEDLLNLLPIKNIEGLNESIKLIDFSLGITRKNRN